MASKRGRFTAGSSSRNNPSANYNTSKFTSLAAQEEFERLKAKSIIKERGLHPTARDGELVEMIQERGWANVCEAPAAVPVNIIREFYANAKAEMNGMSWVRGFPVDYRAEAIRSLLNLPARPEGVEDWAFKARSELDLDYIVTEICVPGTEWKRAPGSNEHVTFRSSTLNRYARAWYLFLCANLLPSSHTNDVTVERAILLWGILNEEYIDAGYLLHQSMLRFMRGGTTAAIPHASIIAELCKLAGVVWDEEEQLQQPSAVIDSAAIARMSDWGGGAAHHRGLGYILDEDEGDESRQYPSTMPIHDSNAEHGTSEAEPSVAQVQVDPASMSDVQYRRLTRRIDAMEARNRSYAEDLTASLRAVLGDQVQWPVFGAHQPYPPPDTPPEDGNEA